MLFRPAPEPASLACERYAGGKRTQSEVYRTAPTLEPTRQPSTQRARARELLEREHPDLDQVSITVSRPFKVLPRIRGVVSTTCKRATVVVTVALGDLETERQMLTHLELSAAHANSYPPIGNRARLGHRKTAR